jgi:hypothetical protein
MPLERSDIELLARDVRSFFSMRDEEGRPALKSDNNANPTTEKEIWRNVRAKEAESAIIELRALEAQERFSPYQYGEYLYTDGHRVGDCKEMAAVASYRAHHIPEVSEKMNGLYLAKISEHFGSHEFLIVKDGPNRPRLGQSVAQFTSSNSRGIWIVDAWIGDTGCCRAHEYGGLIRTQYAKWQGQGKVNAWGAFETNADGYPIPTNSYPYQSHGNSLVNSEIFSLYECPLPQRRRDLEGRAVRSQDDDAGPSSGRSSGQSSGRSSGRSSRRSLWSR